MNKIKRVSQTIRVLLALAIVMQFSVWLYFLFANPQSTNTPPAGQLNSEFNQGAIQRPSQEAIQQPIQGHTDVSLSSDFEGVEWAATQLLQIDMNAQLWLSTPGMIIQIAIYWTLFLLFSQFYRGQIFSSDAVFYIRRLGLWVLMWPVVLFIYPPLLIGGLKVIGLLEHGELSISLGSDDFAKFIAGAMIMVVGWVMHEATRLKNEQELTI